MEETQQVKYQDYQFSIKIIQFTSQLFNKRIFWIITDQLRRSFKL